MDSRSEVVTLGGGVSGGGTGALGDVRPALYSITYLGLWYRGEALPLEEVVRRAAAFGYAGVEIDGKRPHGCPLDWPTERCRRLRQQVEDAGLEIAGVAADNDFSSPFADVREAQVANVCALVRMTADLGAKVLRVFLAWPGATPLTGGGARYDLAQKAWQYTYDLCGGEEAWTWCRDCLVEASRFAGEHGVVLALQNHKPLIRNYRQVLQMVDEVGSPHLKACLDAPIMESRDPDYLREAVRAVGDLQVQTHFGGDYERMPDGRIGIREVKSAWCGPYTYGGFQTDDIYTPFVQALLETGYRGYIGYELCHPLPVVDGRTVGLDYVDASCRLAAEYMRDVIAQARARALAAPAAAPR